MSNSIQNLFKNENVIILDIKNIRIQLSAYLKEIERIMEFYDLEEHEDEADWFTRVFTYYLDLLIPALEDSTAMEERYIEVLKSNPDIFFDSINLDDLSQQNMINQFIDRFKSLHKDFYSFTQRIKHQ